MSGHHRNSRIASMARHYRSVRRRVFEEATRLESTSVAEHAANQRRLREHVETVCRDANLDKYNDKTREAARRLWRQLWTKNRYAGIKAVIASREIGDLLEVFDLFEDCSSPDWDIEIERREGRFELTQAGLRVREFANRTGIFEDKCTVANLPKLRTLVLVARRMMKFLEEKAESTPPIHFVTGGVSCDDVWAVHAHLVDDLGYRGDLTALHFMMDIGFPVMKPDIVISHLFHCWGWLDAVLPAPLTAEQVERQYTQPRLYRPVIDLSREISASPAPADLLNDIGWVTGNPLREFDLFMVKFGQEPE